MADALPSVASLSSWDARRVLVIMPTYNEADTLADSVQHLRDEIPDVNVLIVDDNSPDGTGQVANELCLSHQQTFVLHRSHKDGLGPAYLAGFDWALTRDFDFVAQMDADGSHRPIDLRRLLDTATQSPRLGLVIGSRWVRGGEVRNWAVWRRALSVGGNLYTRLMLGLRVNDTTAGFRVFRTQALRDIDRAGVHSAGYCFQIDMTRRAVRAGVVVTEVPIVFIERRAGRSKMSNAIIVEALWRVTVWGWQRLVHRSQ